MPSRVLTGYRGLLGAIHLERLQIIKAYPYVYNTWVYMSARDSSQYNSAMQRHETLGKSVKQANHAIIY